MCRPLAQTFLLRGPDGSHGSVQIVAHDMVDFRKQRDKLLQSPCPPGSHWTGKYSPIEELILTSSVSKVFPHHDELIETDDIPCPDTVH